MSDEWLGAILAGGESRRFGRHKALAELGGRQIIERVRDAVCAVLPRVVLVTHRPELYRDLRLPSRPDRIAGMGALGGVHAALHWARDEGRPGALCVACDMPFLSAPLLRRLLQRAAAKAADAVAPESLGPRALEPLAAVYSVACIPEIERRLGRGERSLSGLLGAVRTDALPISEVREFGDPEVLFLNVNTPDHHHAAQRIAAGERAHAAE